MSFRDRIATANELITELTKAYWSKYEITTEYSISHVPYGYETHIPVEPQDILKQIFTKTSKHIRFTPDFILLQKGNPDVFLCEYKVTRTPRYSLGEQQWNFGQVEADAWENYINLVNAGINVVVIMYCPYHYRPLLGGEVKLDWLTVGRTSVRDSTGSGTPYVNLDLRKIGTFEDFMHAYFNIPLTLSYNLLSANFFRRLRANPNLTTTHNIRSPYNNSRYATGFNWDKRYL